MFNQNEHVTQMQGRDYLEVKWRIAWFRDVHPTGSILTQLEMTEPVVMKATVADGEGRVLATGYGTPKTQGVAKSRPFEGAETAAIGRALAAAGFGTQFTGDAEDDVVDSPVDRPTKSAASPARAAPAEKNGKPPAAHPKKAAVVKWAVKEGLAENEFAAAGVYDALNKTGAMDDLLDNGDGDKVRAIIRLYRAWRTAGAEVPVAATHALSGNSPEAVSD